MLLVEIFTTRMLPLKTFAKIKNSSTNVKTCHKQVGQVIDIRPHRRRAWTVHWYSPRFANVHPVQYTPMGIRTVSVLPPAESLWVHRPANVSGHDLGRPLFLLKIAPLRFISFKISNKGSNGHWYAAKNTYKIQYNTEKNKHKDNISNKKLEQVISRPRYPRLFRLIDSHKKNNSSTNVRPRMWANAQRDGRPA